MTSVPFAVRGSEAFDLRSEIVDDTFAIGVVRPDRVPGPPSTEEEFQLVYVLDGWFMLPVASAICTLQRADLIRPGFPPLLLVGIDYPEGAPNQRTRDYTMPDTLPEEMAAGMKAAGVPYGGASAFLSFLTDELDPLIRERYPVKAGPAGLLGDSFGGTFGLHAFLEQPPLFDKYWLGSPGVFTTGTDYVAQVAKLLENELAHPTKMFLTLGELEATGPIDFYNDLGTQFGRLVDVLETVPNASLTHAARRYPDATHTSVLAPAVNDALRYLFAPGS
jgi:predicted alpha/beta superfamily hydrolase